MAEKKTTKQSKKKTDKKVEAKTASPKKVKAEPMSTDVNELKVDLQKVYLEVKTGQEQDVSKIKKIKRQIARLKTNKK